MIPPLMTCVVDSGYLANCQLGDMPVDDIRTVTVTVLAVDTNFSQLSGRVSADVDDKYIDNDATNGLQIRNPVDLGVFSIGGTSRVESRAATDHVPIYSESTMAATDFVATWLPVVRLTALALSGTTCEIIDPRHGRCTAATLAHQMTREILITAIGDAPGVYPVRVAISATGDADTSDNSAEYNVQITPFADAGVTPINVPQYVFLGQVYQFGATRTSYRDTPNVSFMLTYPVSVSITAPADLTGCVTQRSVDNRYDTLLCQMALVPANTDRLLQFQLRGLSAGDGGRVTAQAWTSYDVNWDNNASDVPVQVVEDSDVAVELAISATESGNQPGVAAYYSARPRQRILFLSADPGIRVHQVGFFRLGMHRNHDAGMWPGCSDAGNGNQLRYHSRYAAGRHVYEQGGSDRGQ
jgi:hypothetical protein